MKLITVLLIATMMQVSAASFAQKLTLKKDNISLEQLFKEIRKQTGYAVIYTAATIKDSKAINADFQNTPIEEVLTTSLKDQSLKFEIDTKNIIITKETPTFLDRLANGRAYRDIRGRVLDEKGNPLPKANILIEGTDKVYQTDEKGIFEIKEVDDKAKLIISYVGYKILVIAVKDAVIPLEIKLNQLTGELEEVKVTYNTGYQELDLKKSTGSVVQIDNKLFNRQVGTNVLTRIYNVTSGLIANPTGRGGKNTIRIRGESTINANKQPLIVVDNFPYEGDLNSLNPNDVESITILKDAAASAIWGVRAGNGVIVVNTKKGRYNHPIQVSLVSNLTITEKPNLFYIPYLSNLEMIEFEKQRYSTGTYNDYDDFYAEFGIVNVLPQSIEILLAARKKNMGVPDYDATTDPSVIAQLNELGKHDIRTDINKYWLRNGVDQQYAFNLNGGGDKHTYYASVGYDHITSNDIKNNNSRLSLNLNNTFKPMKHFEIITSLVHTRGKNMMYGDGSYNSFLPYEGNSSLYTRLVDDQGNPLVVARDNRSSYLDTLSFNGLLDWRYRPLEEKDHYTRAVSVNDTRIFTALKYKVTEGFQAEIQYQNQRSLSNDEEYYSQSSYEIRNSINSMMYRDAMGNLVSPYPMGDRRKIGQTEFNAWNLRAILNFNKSWKDHTLTGFVGMEIRETTSEFNSNYQYGFDPNTNTHQPVSYTKAILIQRPVLSSGIIGSIINPESLLTRHGSQFANVGYSLKNKYLLSASGRIDESNFFGLKANLRRTPLWSAGLGWNVHMEKFYKFNWLSQLKLTASYGYTGNTNPGATSFATFRYETEVNATVPNRNIVYGVLRTPNNPGLSWERVKIINLGLEFAFRGGRLQGTVEYYKKNGLDLIGPINTEPTIGVNSYVGNYGSMKGTGWDFTLQTKNINGEFKWNTSVLLSTNRDKITAYGGAITNADAVSLVTGTIPKTGIPVNYLFSYKFAGLDPINGDPRIFLGDTISHYRNRINAKLEDLIYSGQTNPKVFGSIRNEFRYGSVTVSANIIYRFGHIFRRPSVNYPGLMNSGWIAHSDYELRWKNLGDESTTNVPSFSNSASNTNRNLVYIFSDALVEKGDVIRLQDIRVSYDFNSGTFKRLPIKNTSIFLYAENLGILWRANKKGIDPDAYVFGTIPQPRRIAFGLNVNF